MAAGSVEVRVKRPADEVFALVSDFGGIGQWMPGIDACELRGDERVLSLGGMTVVERDLGVDPASRTARYGIVGGDIQLARHQASIQVRPDQEGCVILWSFEVEPDELQPVFQQTYQRALDALARTLDPEAPTSR
jgi:carbon monoxide dehydrogenase subunit G